MVEKIRIRCSSRQKIWDRFFLHFFLRCSFYFTISSCCRCGHHSYVAIEYIYAIFALFGNTADLLKGVILDSCAVPSTNCQIGFLLLRRNCLWLGLCKFSCPSTNLHLHRLGSQIWCKSARRCLFAYFLAFIWLWTCLNLTSCRSSFQISHLSVIIIGRLHIVRTLRHWRLRKCPSVWDLLRLSA